MQTKAKYKSIKTTRNKTTETYHGQTPLDMTWMGNTGWHHGERRNKLTKI